MRNYHSVCICGGGGLGHTLAANISSNGCKVNLLTGHPDLWSHDIEVYDCNNKTIKGNIDKISNSPKDVIADVDIILLCVPGYLIQRTLKKIAPFVKQSQEIGSVISSSGFFWMANHELGCNKRLFGFQRVPFISRVIEYGKKGALKGYKSLLKIGGSKVSDLEGLSSFFTKALNTPTIPLSHYLEATLTNSNPILHPSRIYGMLSDIKEDIYDKEFLFYEEWDDKSSSILIDCDTEFQRILSRLPIHQKEIPTLLDYYESTDAHSLTQKIRSIKAFQGIKMSMVNSNGKFKVDYNNRYFTEDIPFGLLIIKSLGVLLNEKTPKIDLIVEWMQSRLDKEYLINGELKGKDLKETGIIQNFNIATVEDLLNL